MSTGKDQSDRLFLSRLQEWQAKPFKTYPFEGVYPIEGAVLAAKLKIQFLSMQKYVYSFRSSVGTFWIRPERDKSWGLYIGGEGIVELLGYYDSAFAAADSAYMQTTGWDGWDRRKRVDVPPTLLLWSKKLVK